MKGENDMCFEVHPKHPIAKVAKKDIVCYKVLDDNMRPLHFSRRDPYVLNSINPSITLKAVLTTNIWTHCTEIEHGYHSYSSKIPAKRVFKFCYSPHKAKLVSCIIPKGKVYYFNPDKHEYVSTNIIIKEVIK